MMLTPSVFVAMDLAMREGGCFHDGLVKPVCLSKAAWMPGCPIPMHGLDGDQWMQSWWRSINFGVFAVSVGKFLVRFFFIYWFGSQMCALWKHPCPNFMPAAGVVSKIGGPNLITTT